jgi:hypothetical protein
MRALVVAWAFTGVACATIRPPDLDELKPTVEAFHQRVRWKDFRSAADLVVPEHRDAFIKARSTSNDERDLSITDFQLEDAKLSPDRGAALAVSKISWYRLPSSTETTATVTSTFVWRENTWYLESQDTGPFEDLRPAPAPAPVR